MNKSEYTGRVYDLRIQVKENIDEVALSVARTYYTLDSIFDAAVCLDIWLTQHNLATDKLKLVRDFQSACVDGSLEDEMKALEVWAELTQLYGLIVRVCMAPQWDNKLLSLPNFKLGFLKGAGRPSREALASFRSWSQMESKVERVRAKVVYVTELYQLWMDRVHEHDREVRQREHDILVWECTYPHTRAAPLPKLKILPKPRPRAPEGAPPRAPPLTKGGSPLPKPRQGALPRTPALNRSGVQGAEPLPGPLPLLTEPIDIDWTGVEAFMDLLDQEKTLIGLVEQHVNEEEAKEAGLLKQLMTLAKNPRHASRAHRVRLDLERLLSKFTPLSMDIDRTNSEGESALYVAAKYNNPVVVEALIKAGADVSFEKVVGNRDTTPEGIATRNKHISVLQHFH